MTRSHDGSWSHGVHSKEAETINDCARLTFSFPFGLSSYSKSFICCLEKTKKKLFKCTKGISCNSFVEMMILKMFSL